jgi:uncharacterized SAM-binding protein YcdF (DUF218 family)
MLRRLTRAVLTGMALLLLASTVSFLFLLWQINRTGARDQAQPADAIIVLGARVEQNGQPGPDLRARTLHGVRLFKQGLAPYLICTGGFRNDRLSAASVARNLAVHQGVPAERVLLADGSMTTEEDALSTRQLADAHRLQTAILVSHPLHLERARLLFEEQGITVYPSPTSTDLDAIPWLPRAWLSIREAVGILWLGLEALGVPYDWTERLSHWVYGAAATPAPGAN